MRPGIAIIIGLKVSWPGYSGNEKSQFQKDILKQERSPLMTNILEKLFEHNNWANLQIIQACSALSDEQLDAEPRSATIGSIRSALLHLVASQRGYLSLLTLPVEERLGVPLTFAEVQESVRISGEALLALAR